MYRLISLWRISFRNIFFVRMYNWVMDLTTWKPYLVLLKRAYHSYIHIIYYYYYSCTIHNRYLYIYIYIHTNSTRCSYLLRPRRRLLQQRAGIDGRHRHIHYRRNEPEIIVQRPTSTRPGTSRRGEYYLRRRRCLMYAYASTITGHDDGSRTFLRVTNELLKTSVRPLPCQKPSCRWSLWRFSTRRICPRGGHTRVLFYGETSVVAHACSPTGNDKTTIFTRRGNNVGNIRRTVPRFRRPVANEPTHR